jgi:hypothetical protein
MYSRGGHCTFAKTWGQNDIVDTKRVPKQKKNETSIKAHSKGNGWLDTSDASQFE